MNFRTAFMGVGNFFVNTIKGAESLSNGARKWLGADELNLKILLFDRWVRKQVATNGAEGVDVNGLNRRVDNLINLATNEVRRDPSKRDEMYTTLRGLGAVGANGGPHNPNAPPTPWD